ncbi:hypothetical protein [Nonomuraea ceibae]|uniref:hypothetical protein n=1 Tax=Nonomuraea ceibae TaxID=1935170 RepID=UPI001C5E633B|nr:hypothetical protein [Nonomuraea ceibae]
MTRKLTEEEYDTAQGRVVRGARERAIAELRAQEETGLVPGRGRKTSTNPTPKRGKR